MLRQPPLVKSELKRLMRLEAGLMVTKEPLIDLGISDNIKWFKIILFYSIF